MPVTPHQFMADMEAWHTIPTAMGMKIKNNPPINRGAVHAQSTVDRPEMATRELHNVIVVYAMPSTMTFAQVYMNPNLPWAEDHFRERIGGEPLNPAPSHNWWPYARAGNAEHTDYRGRFSHTYPERFWPKQANPDEIMQFPNGREAEINVGIRYPYGDLDDVVHNLHQLPFTRQAFLPIWFPEDTYAADAGLRVPCTLGYHFIRNGRDLDCNYFMRSCDLFRFFNDDAYMAVRLVQHICERLDWVVYPGTLTMFISNLHIFQGDAV